MSFGALSRNAKAGIGLGASRAGTSTTTGDGGMHPMERENSDRLIYQICPSHYGNDAHDMASADAVEIVVGQGAKPGTGGVLLGAKVSDEVARMRDLPLGVDQRSPVRHPDFIGPADLRLKIEQIREATDGQIPVYVKIGAARTRDDVKLAAKAGADVIVIDGMEGGSAATPDILYDHTGIPTHGGHLRGPPRPRGHGAARRGADRAAGRHQERRRRGEGAGAGRRRGRRRLGRDDRARLQLAATTSRTTTRSASSRATAPCATPASAPSASRRRTSA